MARGATRRTGLSALTAPAAAIAGPSAAAAAVDASTTAAAAAAAASGVTPTEAYGFAGWLAALASWAAYLAWVWVPPAVWARAGVAVYVPSRYWALAGPAALVVVVCSYTLVYGALSECGRRGPLGIGDTGAAGGTTKEPALTHSVLHIVSPLAGLLLNPSLDELTTLTDGASKPPLPQRVGGTAAAAPSGREWSVPDVADEPPHIVVARRFGHPQRTLAAAAGTPNQRE